MDQKNRPYPHSSATSNCEMVQWLLTILLIQFMGASALSTKFNSRGLSCPRERNGFLQLLTFCWNCKVMFLVICCPLTCDTLHRRHKMRFDWLNVGFCHESVWANLSGFLCSHWRAGQQSVKCMNLFSLDLASLTLKYHLRLLGLSSCHSKLLHLVRRIPS